MLEAYRADDRFRKPWMICSRYIINASANTRVGATRLGAGRGEEEWAGSRGRGNLKPTAFIDSASCSRTALSSS